MQDFTPDGNYSWFRLAISVLAATAACVGMWAVVLALPQVQAEFGLARGDASIAYTANMIGFAAGNLLLGRAVDRVGIAPVLMGAGVVLSVAFYLASLTQSMTAFAALQFVIGVATASGFAPLLADVSHWFRKRRGIAVATAACGNYLAGAIWPLLLKDTLEADGWRGAFIIIAMVCAAVMVPLALLLLRRPPESALVDPVTAPGGPERVGTTLSVPAIQGLLIIAGIGCCVAMSMPQVHIVAYSSDLGYGITAGAQMLSVMLAAGVVSRLVLGLVADRIGGVKTILISSTLQCLALFLYIPFDGLASLYVVSLIFGLSQGGIVPSYAIVVREYMPAREAGRRVGTVIMATVAGMALGGWLSGLIYDLTGSYEAAFLNGIAWNVMNIAIMFFLLMRTRQPRMATA